jgi:uncharacterized protein (TIGR02145 family)
VAWAPGGILSGGGSGSAVAWASVPSYVAADYPKEITPESGYHTIANVKAGKGDPCRLVGLDLAKINDTAAASLTYANIDNGRWRLPTPAEQQSFSGRELNGNYTEHWTTLNGVNGGMFPNTTIGDAATFLPAAGGRNNSSGQVFNQNSAGLYWSSTPLSTVGGEILTINSTSVYPLSNTNYAQGFSVRCVRQ